MAKNPKAETPPKELVAPLNANQKSDFLYYLPRVVAIMADLEQVLAEAKEDGFTKADFAYALAVQDAEKEAKIKAKIERQVLIAGFVGSSLGSQLDLFELPLPPVDTSHVYTKPVPEIGPAGFAPFTEEELETQQMLADQAKH